MIIQVYHQDRFGRNELYGYGFTNIPTTPGSHTIEISTWRPTGTFSDQLWGIYTFYLSAYFLGATPQLKNLVEIQFIVGYCQ